MPITWQNINIGNAGSANALLTAGSDQMLAGLDKLTNVAEDVGKQNTANYNMVARQNTTDALSKLSAVTSSADLLKAIETGELDTAVMDKNLGKQYDKGAVSSAIEDKRTNLINKEMSLADKLKAEQRQVAQDARQVAADKRTEEIHKETRAMNAMAAADRQRRLAQEQRSNQLFMQANEVIKGTKNIDEAKLALRKTLVGGNQDGLLAGRDLLELENTLVRDLQGVGLTETQKLDSAREAQLASNLSAVRLDELQKAETKFKKEGGFDPVIDQLLADTTTDGNALTTLAAQITEKAKGEEVPNTTGVAREIEKLKNFWNESGMTGLPPLTGAMIIDVMTAGGHSDQFITDPDFEFNRDIARQMMVKAYKHTKFNDSNAEQLRQFAQTRAEITNNYAVARDENLRNRAAESFSKSRTDQVVIAQITPMENVDASVEAKVKALKAIKPILVNSPFKEPEPKDEPLLKTSNYVNKLRNN